MVCFLMFSLLHVSCNAISFYIEALLQSFVILQIVSISGNIFYLLTYFLNCLAKCLKNLPTKYYGMPLDTLLSLLNIRIACFIS